MECWDLHRLPKYLNCLLDPLPHTPHAQGVFNVLGPPLHWSPLAFPSRRHSLHHCSYQTPVKTL